MPVLDLAIEPGEDIDLEMLGFTWRVENITSNTVTI